MSSVYFVTGDFNQAGLVQPALSALFHKLILFTDTIIQGFNVTIQGQLAVVYHPSQWSIQLIIIKEPASNFNFLSALDFYLINMDEPVTKEDI